MAWRRGKAYPQELRDQVLAAVGAAQAVAARFGVSTSYVRKVRQLRRSHGALPAEPSPRHVLTGFACDMPGDALD